MCSFIVFDWPTCWCIQTQPHVVLCNTRKLVKHNMLSGMPFTTPTQPNQPLPRPYSMSSILTGIQSESSWLFCIGYINYMVTYDQKSMWQHNRSNMVWHSQLINMWQVLLVWQLISRIHMCQEMKSVCLPV